MVQVKTGVCVYISFDLPVDLRSGALQSPCSIASGCGCSRFKQKLAKRRSWLADETNSANVGIMEPMGASE